MSHVSPHAETAAPTRQQRTGPSLHRRPATHVAGSTTPVRPTPMADASSPATEHPAGVSVSVAGDGPAHPG